MEEALLVAGLLEFRVSGFGFRVSGLRFRVSGSWVAVLVSVSSGFPLRCGLAQRALALRGPRRL